MHLCRSEVFFIRPTPRLPALPLDCSSFVTGPAHQLPSHSLTVAGSSFAPPMLPNNEVRVPRARVAQPARDITAEFTVAAAKIKPGKLVKDELFTLFEAVGALEIMDSKMDSGYIAPGENQAQALEDDYDVRRELTPAEVVGLMDELLCHEMAWHMGHPLSQTLFTSIYLDKLLWPVPRTVEDARFDRTRPATDLPLVNLVLRAYCLALVKACDFVHSRVAAEYFFEEEDFVTQLYSRNLLSVFDPSHFERLLDRAIDWIDKETEMEEKLRDAIRCRLVFRREFLLALDRDLDVLESRSTVNFVSCVSQLELLTESVSLGKSVPEAFSLKIQRKLASTVPPRPIVHISHEAALAHLKRICQDAIDMQHMLDYRGPSNFKTAVWTLLSRKPQPSVYIRCLLQALIVSDMTILGAVSVKQFLYDDIAELVLPSSILLQASTDEVELPSHPRFQIAQHMEGFVKRFSRPFVDTVQCACLNRCRIRRTLCHTMVDWDNLQMEAEELDVQLRTLTSERPIPLPSGEPTFSYPLSSWAYHQKLIQLRLVLQMGFELSIYSPEELPGMYWYLSHICTTHLGHLDRIRTFTVAARKRDLMATSSRSGTSSQPSSAFHQSFRSLERLTTHLIAIDAFSIALHALYVLLTRHRLLPLASSPQAYSSEKLRYELRMKPFIPVSLPELVPYQEFKKEANLEGDSDVTVLERASNAIAEARRAWEATLANGAFIEDPSSRTPMPSMAIEEDWKRDVKDTMRACIGASLAIETIKKALAGQTEMATLEVTIPDAGSKAQWHDWWVVPQDDEIIDRWRSDCRSHLINFGAYSTYFPVLTSCILPPTYFGCFVTNDCSTSNAARPDLAVGQCAVDSPDHISNVTVSTNTTAMPIYPIRRRPRECKTCLACRASKVRCDRNVPCSNCVKRNFTCSYSRPPPTKPAASYALASTESSTPSQSFSFSAPYQSSREQPRPAPAPHRYEYTERSAGPVASDDGEVVDISQTEWDEINNKMVAMEQLLGSLQSLFNAHPAKHSNRASEAGTCESTRSEGNYGSGSLKSGPVHLGSRSALVDILDKSKLSADIAQALPQDELLAELVLGNESAAYPFLDLWSSDPFTFNIAGVCAVLPDDEQCRRFLGFYKDISAVLYPVLPDLSELERNTNRLLEGRRREGGVYRPDNERLVKPFGTSLPFLSLLFAVLAAGCQLSDLSDRERELTSWVYVSCAYQCLRMLNYVSQPSVEVIQILLIIGNVLSYNMNAGAAYTMLGMTERLCMVLGLHVESTGYSFAEQAVRRRVWWAMAFQNSHFSLAYDRPSITMVSQPEIPFDRKSMPGHRTYFETLCQVVSLALEILRSRMYPESSHPRFHDIREYKQRIQMMLAEASPHLQYREQCRTLRGHIERTELRLHSSYLLSVLCRVSLDPHAHLDDQRRRIIREDCIRSLMDTIDAFVELHEINSRCSRSWISLQRSIASAFLLLANDDSPQTWGLIDRLETVLADHVYADGHEDYNRRTDSVKHLASSLRALREIRTAFRGTKLALPADAPSSSPMGFPSPPSVDAAPDMPPPSAPVGPVPLPMEDWNMLDILGRVPDAMLFPSMGGAGPAA